MNPCSGGLGHVGDAGLQMETQVKGKAETNEFYKLRTYHAPGPLLGILGGHAGDSTWMARGRGVHCTSPHGSDLQN